jgi:hypothetical protein
MTLDLDVVKIHRISPVAGECVVVDAVGIEAVSG